MIMNPMPFISPKILINIREIIEFKDDLNKLYQIIESDIEEEGKMYSLNKIKFFLITWTQINYWGKYTFDR